MTPFEIRFQIEWKLGDAELQKKIPPDMQPRLQGIYFDGAAQCWKYAIKGWPSRSDGTPLALPRDHSRAVDVPLSYLAIKVIFDRFTKDEAAVARIDPDSILTVPGPDGEQFPYQATMQIDLNDIKDLLADRPRFLDTVTHELGHALGIGTLFPTEGKRRLVRAEGDKAWYIGAAACRAYAGLLGRPYDSVEIPLDTEYDRTTKAYHWSEEKLRLEIMSASLDAPGANSDTSGISVISAVSIGALQDLGYVVEPRAARPLVLQARP